MPHTLRMPLSTTRIHKLVVVFVFVFVLVIVGVVVVVDAVTA